MALPILSQKDLNDNINKAVADLYFKDTRVLSQHHLTNNKYTQKLKNKNNSNKQLQSKVKDNI